MYKVFELVMPEEEKVFVRNVVMGIEACLGRKSTVDMEFWESLKKFN